MVTNSPHTECCTLIERSGPSAYGELLRQEMEPDVQIDYATDRIRDRLLCDAQIDVLQARMPTLFRREITGDHRRGLPPHSLTAYRQVFRAAHTQKPLLYIPEVAYAMAVTYDGARAMLRDIEERYALANVMERKAFPQPIQIEETIRRILQKMAPAMMRMVQEKLYRAHAASTR